MPIILDFSFWHDFSVVINVLVSHRALSASGLISSRMTLQAGPHAAYPKQRSRHCRNNEGKAQEEVDGKAWPVHHDLNDAKSSYRRTSGDTDPLRAVARSSNRRKRPFQLLIHQCCPSYVRKSRFSTTVRRTGNEMLHSPGWYLQLVHQWLVQSPLRLHGILTLSINTQPIYWFQQSPVHGSTVIFTQQVCYDKFGLRVSTKTAETV